MKISSLKASDVHGYLFLDIHFRSEITFLIGLNGSGKTTALRLLMGLLAPSIDELIELTFTTVEAKVAENGNTTVVSAIRSRVGIQLFVSSVVGSLDLSDLEVQTLRESRRPEEGRTPLSARITSHPVFKAIRELATPMFLGLDRRLHIEERDADGLGIRRRPLHLPRYSASSEVSIRRVTDAILADVNDLVSTALYDVRRSQERLDSELRNQILLDSFRYEPAAPSRRTFPSRSTLNKFRERQAGVEKAASGLNLPVGELKSSLATFFEKMSNIVESMEQEANKATQSKKPKKKDTIPEPVPNHVVEWIMNSRQADRIFKQVELLDDYVSRRTKLYEPVDRFLGLANLFLLQTGKRIKISERSTLRVELNGVSDDKGLFALSSGERQLVVMLAHLSLNPRLAKSGVFIVDEPELSLHVGWQEQFVGAIRKANPKVQLILATHSPAIILDLVAECESLSK